MLKLTFLPSLHQILGPNGTGSSLQASHLTGTTAFLDSLRWIVGDDDVYGCRREFERVVLVSLRARDLSLLP